MAIELAAAYLTIIPSLKGATRQIQEQLGGVGPTVGKKISEGISAGLNIQTIGAKIEGIGGSISGVGSKLTSGITKPAGIAATAVAGLVTALGFKRLVGIDTARGQFKGLGYDADAVMKQVDAGVTGTALSMAEGASMAVGILATGAVPLEELEKQIQRTANVSAAYNVDAAHAGNLLNAVLTKNKVTYGDLSQMQANGIPIISQLADHYGVAGDAIMKMAQDGEISIEDLNHVLDKNAGAAAEEYANTWRGVTANIMSNIGRIGAQVLDTAFPQLKEQAEGFLEVLRSDDLKTFAADIGVTLGNAIGNLIGFVKDAVTWWNNLSPSVQKAVGAFAGAVIAAGPVLSIVGKITTGVGKLVGGVGSAVTGIAKFGTAAKSGFETVQIASMFAWDGVRAGGAAVKAAATGFGTMAKMQWQYVAAGAKATATTVAQGAAFVGQKVALVATTVATKAAAVAQRAFNLVLNANPIGLIITAIAALVAGLIWFFTQTEIGQKVWANFTQFLTEAWANIVEVAVGIWNGLGKFFVTLWDEIKALFSAVLQWVVDAFMNWTVYGLIIKNWDAIVSVFKDTWTKIKNAVKSGIDWVTSIIKTGTAVAKLAWDRTWQLISDLLTNTWTGIKNTVKSGIDWVKNVIVTGIQVAKTAWDRTWSLIGSFFSNVWSSIVNAAKNYMNAVKANFTNVTNFVRDIPGKIMGFFKNIGSLLLDSGKALIRGFINGIKAGFESAKGAVADGISAIRDFFPFSPAKTGPFSGRGWVAYAGVSLGQTFTESIADSLSDGRKGIHDEMGGIEDEFDRLEAYANGTEFSVRAAVPSTEPVLADLSGSAPLRMAFYDADGVFQGYIGGQVASGLRGGSSNVLARDLGRR